MEYIKYRDRLIHHILKYYGVIIDEDLLELRYLTKVDCLLSFDCFVDDVIIRSHKVFFEQLDEYKFYPVKNYHKSYIDIIDMATRYE